MIYEHLFTGKENAQTSRELCQRLGLKQRELTIIIENERRAGYPICSNTGRNAGYYLAANKKEMQECCYSLKSRAIEIFKTRQACLNCLDQLPE